MTKQNTAAKVAATETATTTEKSVAPTVTAAQKKVMESLSTWSAKIRYLDGEDYSRGQIAKILGKRYQHVRNVLITPLTGKKA